MQIDIAKLRKILENLFPPEGQFICSICQKFFPDSEKQTKQIWDDEAEEWVNMEFCLSCVDIVDY